MGEWALQNFMVLRIPISLNCHGHASLCHSAVHKCLKQDLATRTERLQVLSQWDSDMQPVFTGQQLLIEYCKPWMAALLYALCMA